MIAAMDHDEDQLEALGALRAEDDDAPNSAAADEDDDLALHLPPVDEGAEPVAKPEDEAWIDMGTRAIARSAEGLTVENTIEVLPPFEFSV